MAIITLRPREGERAAGAEPTVVLGGEGRYATLT